LNGIQEVGGSIPPGSTNQIDKLLIHVLPGSSDMLPMCGERGKYRRVTPSLPTDAATPGVALLKRCIPVRPDPCASEHSRSGIIRGWRWTDGE
jgi:hypothetical protein